MTKQDMPPGLAQLYSEMARQSADSIFSFAAAADQAAAFAQSLRRTGRLVMLGMGGSHAVGRTAEPLYRAVGLDAIALPLSEQLYQPLPLKGRTVLLTSQSGESAEVLRFLAVHAGRDEVFGMTLEPGSSLAQAVPCLIGIGETEKAFAATRSLTICLALHAAVLAALGQDMAGAVAVLRQPPAADLQPALLSMAHVRTIVTSGRRLCGLAEVIALGLTELSRRPCYALEGGQLRHGPVEMLGPEIGLWLFRGADETAGLVGALAAFAADAGARVVLFDASGDSTGEDPRITRIAVPPATGMAAIVSLLPLAQQLMVAFAASRVADAGTPVRSAKVLRTE